MVGKREVWSPGPVTVLSSPPVTLSICSDFEGLNAVTGFRVLAELMEDFHLA